MKHIKKYEDYTPEQNYEPVEYVAPEREHPSYKTEEKKKKRKKLGEIEPIAVLPNKVKDVISFKPKY